MQNSCGEDISNAEGYLKKTDLDSLILKLRSIKGKQVDVTRKSYTSTPISF